MVLDKIPGPKIFTQRDVRETPASTATATSVGLTDPTYVTLSTDADLNNERVLVAGTNLNMSDGGAGSTITLNLDDNVNLAGDLTVGADGVAERSLIINSDDAGKTLSINNHGNYTEYKTVAGADQNMLFTSSGTGGYISWTTRNVAKMRLNHGLALGATYYSITAPASGAIIEGDVGIGNNSPAEKLDVTGNLKLSANLTDGANTLTVANAKAAYDHIHNLTTDIDHDTLTNFAANEHLDWTQDLGATNIHAGNYTDTNTTYVSSDFVHDDLTGFVANEHIDWTADQGATNINAANYTDTDTTAHASFSQLDYASAGHTGFAPALGADDNYVTDAEKVVIGNTSGSNTGDQDTTYTAGEGLDLVGTTFSGENATTANKGIASFNTNDFTVASGAVSLKSKTSYWTCKGNAFTSINPDVDDIEHRTNMNRFYVTAGPITIAAPVNLPHGAIVTGVIVYGGVGAEDDTWTLFRGSVSADDSSAMATNTVNVADTTITNATIDNSTYGYWLHVSALDTTNYIYGAKITYTTDYI